MNKLLKLKKFKGKTLDQIKEIITGNWYNYGYCVCCGKKAKKICYESVKNRGVIYTCSSTCGQMFHVYYRYGCCDKAKQEPNFAYECVMTCPDHGRRTYGTSDQLIILVNLGYNYLQQGDKIMSRAQALSKRLYEIQKELQAITKQKFDLDMKANKLNEEMWNLSGLLEEENDENEYQHG